MKAVFAILLCAVFSATHAINDTDLVYSFTNCALRAATVGVEGLIPRHDPLAISSFNLTQKVLGVEYHFEITDNILYSLMDLELKQVDVTTYTNPGALNIDYDIYWPVLNFTGNFAWYAQVLGIRIGGKGNYNLLLNHVDFSGLFNLTKPGQEAQGIKENLDQFTLDIGVKDVDANINGAGPGWLTDTVMEATLYFFLNHVPASAGEFLRTERFNGFWIANPKKIDDILTWCATNPA